MRVDIGLDLWIKQMQIAVPSATCNIIVAVDSDRKDEYIIFTWIWYENEKKYRFDHRIPFIEFETMIDPMFALDRACCKAKKAYKSFLVS